MMLSTRPRFCQTMVFAVATAALGALCWCGTASARWGPFSSPQSVSVEGYSGSPEEPFITPDGRYLLFNSSESEPDFSLEYASRINAQMFEFRGQLEGEAVNEPDALSGTPSLDQEGNLYFISAPRSYFETLSTVYTGRFSEGVVTGVHLVPGVSGESLGKVDFDVGVSPDGSTLYVSVGQFGEGGGPTSARIVMFERDGDSFVRSPDSEIIMKAINEIGTLDYAADLSYDGLELFFTAASPAIGVPPGIYRATRAGLNQPFGNVERIAAITGFAEAPSISSDGTTLYYHGQAGEEFVIKAVTRVPAGPTVETGIVSTVTLGTATLNATVNPDGTEVTSCLFEYGTTVGYGSSAPCSPSPGVGEGPVGVSAAITGLSANTTYHFRISATNERATSEGVDETFETPAPGPPPTIKKLSPRKGPATGGISVIITGANFTGLTSVEFGSVEATKVSFNSATSITAVSPAETPGKVTVTVATVNGTSAPSSKDGFTFRRAKKQ
jgi:IPT/TIG domain/WD40-like Beta Propeller Repeat